MTSKFVLVYQENGRRSEALQLMEAVVVVMKSTLSERNPINLSLMQELASRYTEVGRQEEALQLKESIVAKNKSILSEEHPEAVFQRGDLTRSYNELDRGAEASQIAKSLNRARNKLLSEEHPAALSSLNHPSLAPDTQSDFANVEDTYRRILALRVELLGTKHLDTPLSMKNLAKMLRSQSSYDEAADIYQKKLTWREVPEIQQIGTLQAMNHLAELLHKYDGSIEPKQIHRQKLEMRKTGVDSKHLSTSQNMDDLVEVARERVKLDEEDKTHLQTLALKEGEALSTKPLRTNNNLSGIFQDSTRAERVLLMPNRRLQRSTSFGEERADHMYSDRNRMHEHPLYDRRRTAKFRSLNSESNASTAKLDGKKIERSVWQTKQELSWERQDDLFHSPSKGAVIGSAGSEDDSSISSSISSKASEFSAFPIGHDLLGAAFKRWVRILLDDDDIRQLLSKALVKHDHRRVSGNITGLLTWLGRRLLPASNTSAEREVAKLFLTSKRNRAYIDQVIRWRSLSLLKEKRNTTNPETQSQRPAGTVASTVLSGGYPDIDLAFDPNNEEIDISHDYGTARPNHEIDLTKDEQQIITSDDDAEIAFLKSSDAFARLKEELEDFVRPFKNEKMWSKMLWDGDERV
jgi:tetratricopeptide (TPR) repeat protein